MKEKLTFELPKEFLEVRLNCMVYTEVENLQLLLPPIKQYRLKEYEMI